MNTQASERTNSRGFAAWLQKHPGAALVYFLVLPLMACLALILPPIALPTRIANAGFTPISKQGVILTDPDGMELVIPENGISKGGAVRLTSMPLDAFLTSELGSTLPPYLEAKGPLYRIEVQGEQPRQAELYVPIPLDSEPYETLDLYGLLNQRWFKLPFVLNAQDARLESQLNFLPEAAIVVQTLPRAPVISAQLLSKKGLPDIANDVLVQVNPVGLRLADEGSIAGEPVSAPQTNPASNLAVIPTVTNVDENGVRIDLTGNMMADEAQRTAHINALVDLAVQKIYRGYDIAYEGIGPGDEALYTQFIKELARALHARQKTLTITLPAPLPISEDQFDTAGYNWALLGRYADNVKIPLLSDPRAYEGEPSLQDQYLRWAVGQIDRSKIQLLAFTMARDSTADQFTPVPFGSALDLLGPVTIPRDARPGSEVELEWRGLARVGGIEHHEPSGLFYFNYVDDADRAHTVWLENADSLARRVSLALRYNLGGLALADVDAGSGLDERIWTVLENFKSMQPTIVENQLALIWMIDGNVIGKSSVRDPRIIWKAPADGGEHQVQVALSVDGGVTAGSTQNPQVVRLAPVRPTPAPTQVAQVAKSDSQPPAPQPTKAAPVKPTTQPASNPAPKPPPSNFAGRNMFAYGIQIDWTNKDRDVELGQVQQLGFNWIKVQVRWCDLESGPGVADLTSTDDIVNRAGARGLKVLFSVVCAPAWSRADGGAGGSGPPDDMQRAADFMSGLAGKYCNTALGAIEVWNEHNLLTEWHGKPLSAPLYMDMLKRAYTAIKAKCPSMVVVSGAPTPTGWNDGVVAIDDGVFLEQLYQNGLKDYSDAIGAHPSGYNVPALCDIRDPGCNRPEASFQAPFQNRHPSWSFLSTMRRYRDIMVKYGDANKQIWPTEFGWPIHTGGQCGEGPCHPAGADNSPEQAAQWYVQAYQWAKQQGWVGVMIAWQLDFDRGELDAFRILGRPAFDALVAMPK